MEGLIKNKVFLFSVIVNFSLLVFAITSCSETQRQKNLLAKEMYVRLVAEEKLNNATQEKQGVEASIESLHKQLDEERESHALTKKALLQEQLVSQGLKEELNKVSKPGDKP
jgi:peptidoglycan hydrolase CwlO-like protein